MLRKGGNAMENTLEKGKGLKADLKNPNMLNDDAMNQVTGGVSALESAIKGVSGFADFFSSANKKGTPGSKDAGTKK